MATGRGTHRPPRSLSGSIAEEAEAKMKPPPPDTEGSKGGSANSDPLPSPAAWESEAATARQSTAVSDEEFRAEVLGEEKTTKSTRSGKGDPAFGSEESASHDNQPPRAPRRGPRGTAPPWMATGRGTHRPPRSLSGSIAEEAEAKMKPPPPDTEGSKGGSANSDPLPSPAAWESEAATARQSTAVSDEEFRAEVLGEEKTTKTGIRRGAWLAVSARLLFYSSVAAMGVGTYYSLRETEVEGQIFPGKLPMPANAYVVYDFSGDVRALRRDCGSSVEPYRQTVQSSENNLQRVRSDLVAQQERIRLLKEQLHAAEEELKITGKEAQEKGRELWATEGAALEREYDAMVAHIEANFQERSKQIGLPITEKDVSVRAPEAWANAFELSLYSAPPSVNVTEERKWAEEGLKVWHQFQSLYEQKQQALKKKTEEFQEQVAPKVTEIRNQISLLEGRITDSEEEMLPLQQEFTANQNELSNATAQAEAARANFQKQLLQLPRHSIRTTIPVGADGHFEWRRLEQNGRFQTGHYFLWLVTKEGGQEHWSLFPFSISPYAKTEIIVRADSFIPVNLFWEGL
jgi:hypothetical protein